ncbi:MAG TPA: hypothetical protein VIK32_03960, partial [Candidatus Limnocylindrales bacterium]
CAEVPDLRTRRQRAGAGNRTAQGRHRVMRAARARIRVHIGGYSCMRLFNRATNRSGPKFSQDRQHFAFSNAGLADKVDDNAYKFDEGQSASLVAGKNFGIVTNIVTGPDGNLYVTSLTNGAVYMVSHT